MREFFHRLLQRLHDEARPLSRNKHFHALSDGNGRRALRADRHLRDLEEHLEELQRHGERPRIRRLPDGGVSAVTINGSSSGNLGGDFQRQSPDYNSATDRFDIEISGGASHVDFRTG